MKTPDPASDTAAGLARLMTWARDKGWALTPSTRDQALKHGVDVTGVRFKGPQ